ncbi:pentatricopeptide repeat-containing protein 2, mitochondrial-like isoform X2 [Liolophura sinensis]
MITADKLGDVKDKFCSRMETYISGDDPGTVFTDDLKTMLHISSSQEDFNITEKMFREYLKQNEEMSMIQNFSFGPIIMRLLYLLNKPDEACRLFLDPSLGGTFDNTSSFLLLLDKLYEEKQYKKVLEMFEVIQKKELRGFKYPNDCTTLALASCYQMNSQESFERMMEIFVGCRERGAMLTQRSVSFASLLALRQNRPDVSMELLVMKNEEKFVTNQNLKAITLAHLGRYEEAIQILKNTLQRDIPQEFQRGNKIFSDTARELQKSVESSNDPNLIRQLQTVIQRLASGGHISEQTLHDFITKPIVKNRQLQTSFKSRRRSENFHPPEYKREGLTDMA